METCDRCGTGVPAWNEVRMPDGLRLTYCDHHTTKYRAKLNELGARIHRIEQPCVPQSV